MELAALSDTDLVARCREGEDEAWDALVDRFARYVYAIAVQVYRPPEADAEDVFLFQETLARAYEHLDELPALAVRDALATRAEPPHKDESPEARRVEAGG